MNLNKKMRSDIAFQLTVSASKDSALKLASDIRALSEKFWSRHEAEVAVKLSGIPKKRWAQLIQEEVICGRHRKHPKVPQKDSVYSEDAKLILPKKFAYKDTCSRKVGSFLPEDFLDKFPTLDSSVYRHYRTWVITLVSPHTVPDYKNSSLYEADDPLILEYIELSERLELILKEARDMYIDTLDVLDACKTVKQLEGILPEAAKLAPKPAVKTKDVMPTELAEKIRGKIENGIPTSAAA